MEKLLTPEELADLLALSVGHLARVRTKGGGPPFLKIGQRRTGSIRYRLVDVEKWLASRQFASTSEETAA